LQLHASPAQELADLIAEESSAGKAVTFASARCAELDAEWKDWTRRRDAAYREFCSASERHAKAKARVAALSKMADVVPVAVVSATVS
jgi:hypothetical protein